jgi:HSP20 family protein
MKLQELLPARWTGTRAPARREEEAHFLSLHREMNRLFDDFFRGFDLAFPGTFGRDPLEAVSPRVDVSETETDVHVSAELPGIEEKDIEVTLAQGVLTIRGEKKIEREEKDKNYHRVERSFGTFQRSVPLPAEVDQDKAEAVFKKGVLHITLPKAPGPNRKKISVKSGD